MRNTGPEGCNGRVTDPECRVDIEAMIPAGWRTEVLVTIDGAGASHDVIDHLTALNTHATQGKRGRWVEYSIGWPVDERTHALRAVREDDWTAALDADEKPDPEASVVHLTGILRHGPAGDRMSTWPKDIRAIARRVPRPPGEQAKLGEDPDWRYGAFATNTAAGQIQWLDARHRTQAHVEDKIKELKAVGAENLPSKDWDRNCAWLQLAALAASLNAWLRHLALDGQLARAEPKALRYRLLGAPDRHVTHPRQRILKVPPGWAWATDVVNAWDLLQALHPAGAQAPRPNQQHHPGRYVEPRAHPSTSAASPCPPVPERPSDAKT